jgi:hypothetical protein
MDSLSTGLDQRVEGPWELLFGDLVYSRGPEPFGLHVPSEKSEGTAAVVNTHS